MAFPYWAQVWLAAIGLAMFIEANPDYVRYKKVLEIAAGLGLPSLVTAPLAKEVLTTDYLEEPLAWVGRSARRLGLTNLKTGLLNWNEPPANLYSEVILISDVNYDPSVFDTLYSFLHHFLSAGAIIMLSTPQRLAAKPFIEKLAPFCIRQEEMIIPGHEKHITILVLHDKAAPGH